MTVSELDMFALQFARNLIDTFFKLNNGGLQQQTLMKCEVHVRSTLVLLEFYDRFSLYLLMKLYMEWLWLKKWTANNPSCTYNLFMKAILLSSDNNLHNTKVTLFEHRGCRCDNYLQHNAIYKGETSRFMIQNSIIHTSDFNISTSSSVRGSEI